ncbi:mRNA 3'-end-processing protein Rna14p [[Candida] anglica]|uniref:mRNA 3'-end-processing protein RNA14 n=1 Tax=[Candida] anglica TaxID=148631 RepID=A0ABP0EFN1_9ASCO
MFIQSDMNKRLSLDVIGQLEDDLESDPLNYGKWTKLIKQVLAKDKEEQVRSVMTKYLNIFKFDGDQWCNYVNYELNRGEFTKVEDLFKKCLAVTTHVPLCRLYVSYVRRVNDVITGGDSARGIVIQAFEFAVKRVGIDLASSELWEDYLGFLKAWTPAQTWEQQQKNDLIRKVYKRLLSIPTEKLEKLWPIYTNWENEVNPITAKKFIGEKSAEYMLARSWYTEWTNITEKKLRRTIVPYSLNDEDIVNKELVRKQLSLWYAWIDLEKKNKLELKDDSLVQQRIEYVYKQAVTTLPFAPELWFKFNKFWLSSNEEANINKCIDLLSESLVLNTRSCLLTFQLSELYEKDNSVNKATETFDNLIRILMSDYENVTKQIDSIKENIPKDTTALQSNEGDNSDKPDDEDENQPTQISGIHKLSQHEVERMAKLTESQLQLIKVITLVYTKLMILCKRTGGVKEARIIFRTGRQNFPAIGYDFYVSSALMEYYADNKSVANKIFAHGMKSFNEDGRYLLKYLDYMIMINDVENMRVLFEQGLTTLLKQITAEGEGVDTTSKSPAQLWQEKVKERDIKEKKECIKEMFKKFSKFETNYGDLNAVRSLENRYEQYFPDDDALNLFVDRYRDPGSVDVIRVYDLGLSDVDEEEQGLTSNKRRKIVKSESNGTSESQLPALETIQQATSGSYNNAGNVNGNTLQPSEQQPQQQQARTQPFVGSTTYNLLRALPSASYFGPPKDQVFDAGKLVELFSNLPKIPGVE